MRPLLPVHWERQTQAKRYKAPGGKINKDRIERNVHEFSLVFNIPELIAVGGYREVYQGLCWKCQKYRDVAAESSRGTALKVKLMEEFVLSVVFWAK